MEESMLELAARRADFAKLEMWHGLPPDEEMMLRESGGCEFSRRADVQDLLFCFLLADGPQDWQLAGLRACGLMRAVCPGLLVGREVPQVVAVGTFQAAELVKRLAKDEATVRRLMEFYFPPGRQWLREGVARVVLAARVFQPELVMIPEARPDGQEGRRLPGFEDFARMFGELEPDAGAKARGLARSRWSARAKTALRKPIEDVGGPVPALFGKSATVREKYQQAAKGNQNRVRKRNAKRTPRTGGRDNQTHPPA